MINAELLLAEYERIADAPDAIARLRRFILDLAVRGKLVPQQADDEPAAKLLEQIGREKSRLLKAGSIRAPKPVPVIDAVPFSVPTSWAWSSLAEIGLLSPRNEAPDDMDASFVPMPFIAAEYGVANEHEVRRWGEIKKGYTHFAEGDVGLAKITPCFENGKSTVFRGLTGHLGSGTTELHIVRPFFVNADYILIHLKSPRFVQTGIPQMTGTAGQKRVPTDYFAYSPFPLPPLAEQHRIVAKVEELMALCDRLEAARKGREAARDRLAAASLARLNTPDPETFQDDARFALNALPALTTRPDQIKQLRQTILNLAVRGNLVPQSGADSQPVVRKSANGGEYEPSDQPFTIPANWIWTTPMSVGVSRLGKMLDKAKNRGKPRPYLRNINVRWFDFDLSDVLEMPFEDSELPEFELRVGDVLICEGGEPGRAAVWDGRMPGLYFQKAIHRVRFGPVVNPAFFVNVLKASANNGRLADSFTGTGIKHFTGRSLDAFEFPLPPLAEQHRIVAKVDELMALCDRLEASLTDTEATRTRLLDALLAEALATASAPEPLVEEALLHDAV